MTYRQSGFCPACGQSTEFTSENNWYRDYLKCAKCGSIPRERALGYCLEQHVPDWRKLTIHECSPADRAISARMRRECSGYVGSQYYQDVPQGHVHNGYRSENLEALSFADEAFDIHCHLDVLEHVNHPEKCFAEMSRTLKPGGKMIFTTPYYVEKPATERRAAYGPNGETYLLFPAEYHGNPIDNKGALVTFHFGRDFLDLIQLWAPGSNVQMITIHDPAIGVIGEFREVFIVTKRAG